MTHGNSQSRFFKVESSRTRKVSRPLGCLILALGIQGNAALAQEDLLPVEQLGKSIFFDENLSINNNQSCATCHDPAAGWTGANESINSTGSVYEGSILGRFGNRKPPSSAYATESPVFHLAKAKSNNVENAEFFGGNFWDGRATGEKLGNPAADQAQGPFLNPVEQALPDSACVVYRVCTGSYPVSLESVWGPDQCNIDWPQDIDALCGTENVTVALSDADRLLVSSNYDLIALAIAAYEGSSESNAYQSKFDYYQAGLAELTAVEKRGLNLFRGKGKCAQCHSLTSGSNGEPPLLTDFGFHNLGVPRNPDNPFYTQTEFNPLGYDWIDEGLGGFLASRPEYAAYSEASLGKQKVPTLRNVDKRPTPESSKAFGHNGYFKSLEGIVHFYNTRDIKPACADPFTREVDALSQDCWPEPEVTRNIETKFIGDLKLSKGDENAIVRFLQTLTDGYAP